MSTAPQKHLTTGAHLERRSPFSFTTPDPVATGEWFTARSWAPSPPRDGSSEYMRLERDGKTIVIFTSGLVIDLGQAAEV